MGDLVLFSGGRDSTLILYKRAMEAIRVNSFNRVKALSISHTQIPAQSAQKEAREKIKTAFNERQLLIDYLEISITQATNTGVIGGGIVQPVVWLTTAALYLNSQDNLHLGYQR